MASFEIVPGRRIGRNEPCFVIAEVGQNHQGDIQIAKKLIKAAKNCGADCVKFQKSDLKSKFNQAALDRPYNSPHSWGSTYGDHKKHLEFSKEQFMELQQYASEVGINFTASGMDQVSMDFLNSLNVPFFKVGSGDTNNIPLLVNTAKLGKPMVVSTGMQNISTVCDAYNAIFPLNQRICILQCTSAYPTPPEHVHLNVIKVYQDMFPEAVIGYSGHELGNEISIAAVAMGAKVLERHITLDHMWKGSDHVASLDVSEFKNLVSQIRNVELAFGSPQKCLQESEIACYLKLGKTVVARKFLPSGTILSEDMLDIKVADPKGWKAEKIKDLMGKTLKCDIHQDCSILEDYVEL